MKMCLLFLLLVLMSCGSSGDGESVSQIKQELLTTSLTYEEVKLVSELIQMSPMRKADVLRKMLELRSVTDETISRLDHYLSIECFNQDNECVIERKKN